jgi:TPR repeat protein
VNRGIALYERGCDHDAGEACMTLARAYAGGFRVPKDLRRAARYYRKACDAGVQAACSSAPAMEGRR